MLRVPHGNTENGPRRSKHGLTTDASPFLIDETTSGAFRHAKEGSAKPSLRRLTDFSSKIGFKSSERQHAGPRLSRQCHHQIERPQKHISRGFAFSKRAPGSRYSSFYVSGAFWALKEWPWPKVTPETVFYDFPAPVASSGQTNNLDTCFRPRRVWWWHRHYRTVAASRRNAEKISFLEGISESVSAGGVRLLLKVACRPGAPSQYRNMGGLISKWRILAQP